MNIYTMSYQYDEHDDYRIDVSSHDELCENMFFRTNVFDSMKHAHVAIDAIIDDMCDERNININECDIERNENDKTSTTYVEHNDHLIMTFFVQQCHLNDTFTFDD